MEIEGLSRDQSPVKKTTSKFSLNVVCNLSFNLSLLISRKVEKYKFSLQNILICKKMVANEIENHNMQ